MKLSLFDYVLPKELIAQYPLKVREQARLMVLDRKQGLIKDCYFSDIVDFFDKEDLLVLNDTKVLAARILGTRKTGGRLEILLINRKDGLTFNVMIKPARLKLDEEIIFNNGGLSGRLTARNEITFEAEDLKDIYEHGLMPLPPYIKRKAESLDNIYYQTVYARYDGSIAAPTAGLHFSESLIKKIESSGINLAYVTLHVGLGTFKPVKTDDITEHKMEPENFSISDETIRLIKEARSKKRRIFAVGTTALRSLETYAQGVNAGQTDLFIYPGYKFKIADCLLTNFHLPKTTLFMLACAFGGEDFVKKAYSYAIEKKYRFYSYGDAMLVI